jgi:hypothetical protein
MRPGDRELQWMVMASGYVVGKPRRMARPVRSNARTGSVPCAAVLSSQRGHRLPTLVGLEDGVGTSAPNGPGHRGHRRNVAIQAHRDRSTPSVLDRGQCIPGPSSRHPKPDGPGQPSQVRPVEPSRACRCERVSRIGTDGPSALGVYCRWPAAGAARAVGGSGNG